MTDELTGTDALWFIGDNFVAKTYRKHYKHMKLVEKDEKDENKGSTGYYIKDNFEYKAFCNSKFSSNQQNMLARLQNSMAQGVNSTTKTGRLLKYIIILLDDDLISYLNFSQDGVATLLGTWAQWLADQFDELINSRRKQLPSKCKVEPFFYWVTAPTHHYFTKDRNQL